MKNSIEKITIFLIVIMLLATSSFAAVKFSDVGSSLIVKEPSSTTDAGTTINKVLGFLQWGSMAAGIVIIAVLGIKYMMGSVEEKSEYKKSMIPLIVGAIVVMSAFTIAKILFETLG